MRKLSTRMGDHWLLLTQVREHAWRLQVLGDTTLEAEVVADDEAGAKASAVAATFERLEGAPAGNAPALRWNAVYTHRWRTSS